MKILTLKHTVAPFIAVALRFLLLLFIYAVLRIGFYWINIGLFPNVSGGELFIMMRGGVKFDVAALLYLNILYILLYIIPVPFKYNGTYQRIAKWIFVITNSIGIALNLIDYAYYPFTLKRTTGTVIDQFANESNLLKLTFDFLLGYWYLVVLFVGLVYLLAKTYDLIKVEKPRVFSWKTAGIHLILMLFYCFSVYRGSTWRMGTQHETYHFEQCRRLCQSA